MIHFLKKRSVGNRGEDIAVRYLKKKGYQILARNYRNKKGYQVGEIDIVAKEGEIIVFVEVKTRSIKRAEKKHVLPEENITASKLRKLERICQDYLYYECGEDAEHRYDAVSVVLVDGDVDVRHIENMFI